MNDLWDSVFMQARSAYAQDEVPVGAVIAKGKEIISEAHNRVECHAQPAAHAEMLALDAAHKLVGKSLAGYDIYVSLEPCAMCAAAISYSRISRLYFAAYDVKAGAVEHGVQYFRSKACHHRPEIYGGIREQEASGLLRQFFAEKRV